ncbi:hypothetical protein WH91_01045 [Devosia psychrophila]|uniref:Rap1a immunity protein domain-containing protein n=2 Tax=Devosia psychrophila TaxID=728005 RepID=A0A0F5Q1R2_9HYPH|nr:hypothetical protein WH91_01045 [Devosia psychrophila]SFC10299.1 hypothetical protein SAMN04488059_102140 [Devosia psychrophila]
MKTRSKVLGVLLTAALPISPAQAEPRTMIVTVEELQEDCAGEQQLCLGFVVAVADALEATAWPAKRSCRGNEVQLQEILDYARPLIEEPDANKSDGPAFDYLANAFVEKWPC